MGRDEIDRLMAESRKALESRHKEMHDQIKSELERLKKKALSGV